MITDEQIATELENPIVETKADTTLDEQIAKEIESDVVAETIVEEKKDELIVEEKKETVEDDEPIELADDEEKVDIKSEINFDDLKEIGIEVKSKNELKDVLSSLKNEVATYKAKSEEIYANDKIRELNDFVKNGGDIEAYTNNVQVVAQHKKTIENLTKVSPLEAYKFSILQQYGVSTLEELPEDKQQEVEDYIDSKPNIEKEIEGKKIISSEINAYKTEVERIEKGNEEAKQLLQEKNEKYISKVSKSIQSLTAVDGIKVTDTAKQELATILKDPKKALQMLMPLDEYGLPDADAFVSMVYRHKYGEKNMKALAKKAKSAGVKEVFGKVTNSSGQEINQHTQQGKQKDDLADAVNEFLSGKMN